jgi:hypothetical protein
MSDTPSQSVRAHEPSNCECCHSSSRSAWEVPDTEWSHTAGVVLLDYLRGLTEFRYPCTVLLNPVAEVGGSAE